MDSTIVVAPGSDGPPTKKRRISDRKSRNTEYLDLRRVPILESQTSQLEKLMKVLHKRRKIVVVAGAGISVSAGSQSSRVALTSQMR